MLEYIPSKGDNMKYYLEDGSEFTYNGDLTNRVGKGKEGAIYYLNANECVKMYYIDSMLKIEKEIFEIGRASCRERV